MSKKFEDYFSELQADMVSIGLEYVENRADRIYIYGSFEERTIASDLFCCINNKIVEKANLNDAINIEAEEFRYDVSSKRQMNLMEIINDDIEKLYKLCQEYEKDMPTEIKLVYDLTKNSLKAEYRYDLMYSNDPEKFADDIFEEWFEEVKRENSI